MKRKVIQIAGSTQLVSLPRKWAKAQNIQKGDEVDIQEKGNTIVVSASASPAVEKTEIDITNLKAMIPRYIHAMYKRGVDELKLTFSNPEMLKIVQESIGKEAVGYEILEHGKNHCTIKYVTGNIEEFDSILRRTFMMLVTMADESVDAIKSKNFSQLNNIAFLEEANNRFTTICRRYLNKNGAPKSYSKVGPLYFIVESLERIADQYKYTCRYLAAQPKTMQLSRDVFDLYVCLTEMLHDVYTVFYKFDFDLIAKIKEARDKIITESYRLLEKKLAPVDLMLLHHTISATNLVFGLLDPYIVIADIGGAP